MNMIENIEQLRGDRDEPVDDYVFATQNGEVRLSELFGDKRDLIVIHNMGRHCSYCTLWADGFNGVLAHLESRAAFVVVSPDDPRDQREFAESRGWRFRMASTSGSSFNKDMGFEPEPGMVSAGVSCFSRRDDGSIIRTGTAEFCPGDSFNSVWHFFALLADGAAGWRPKLKY